MGENRSLGGYCVMSTRLLKLASEVGEAPVETRLAEYLVPPHPAWSVAGLRSLLQPTPRADFQLDEFQPECCSYDALLNPDPEVADVC